MQHGGVVTVAMLSRDVCKISILRQVSKPSDTAEICLVFQFRQHAVSVTILVVL